MGVLWQPCEDLTSRLNDTNYAVIILNTPINFGYNHDFVVNIWNGAKVRLTVDGGTKRWLTWLKQNENELSEVPPPDLITGDMDSLPLDVLEHFKTINPKIEVVLTPNQNETDFFKAIRELKRFSNLKHIHIDTLYVFAETCGRFDQIMANVNTLFKVKSLMADLKTYLIASSSLTWLLPEGNHTISIPANLRKTQEWCSLIPIGSTCTVTTKGLKWDLDKGTLEFGGMVSSSNSYNGASFVTIKTDGRLIWSMGIKNLL